MCASWSGKDGGKKRRSAARVPDERRYADNRRSVVRVVVVCCNVHRTTVQYRTVVSYRGASYPTHFRFYKFLRVLMV